MGPSSKASAPIAGGVWLPLWPSKSIDHAHGVSGPRITASTECGVQMIHAKALVNHSLPSSGDVTMGYVKPSIDALREATERVAAFLLEKTRVVAEEEGSEAA